MCVRMYMCAQHACACAIVTECTHARVYVQVRLHAVVRLDAHVDMHVPHMHVCTDAWRFQDENDDAPVVVEDCASATGLADGVLAVELGGCGKVEPAERMAWMLEPAGLD